MLSLRETEEIEQLAAILRDALPYEDRLRAELSDPLVTPYAAVLDSEIVGAAAIRWDAPSEMTLLAVDAKRRGRGYGKAIVAAIVEEARARGVGRLLVSTASFSVDNILFYQKCGFRMSHVLRDYFATAFPEKQPPVWGGITLRDMLVLDYQVLD